MPNACLGKQVRADRATTYSDGADVEIIILSGNIGMVVAEYDPPPLGVVYGMAGSDLPDHPKSVVELCHKYGFKKIIKAFVRDV